jgi:Kef-type K+ transport system membrane component KefB
MGMAFLFFIAGLEIDLTAIRGRPLRLALIGWCCGLVLAITIALGMAAAGLTSSWRVVAVALMTTALGVLVPILRDSGAIGTPLGRHVLASGVVGELGPILAISLMISRRFSAGVQAALTTGFVALVILLAWLMARGAKVPALFEPIRRGLDHSGQTPIRIALVLIVALAVLAETFGMDLALGALAAGMMVGFATRGVAREHDLHAKIDAVGFGFLVPLFFLSSGMRLDVRSIFAGTEGLVLLAAFFVSLVVVRLPLLFLLRAELGSRAAQAVALMSATTLSLIVVITAVAMEVGALEPSHAAPMVGAGILTVMLFPALGARLAGMPADSGPAHDDRDTL